MKPNILTVTLNPCRDIAFYLASARSPGTSFQKSALKDVVMSAGGKGINVARALRSLKVSTLATGIVGGATGVWIAKTVKEKGIAAAFLICPQDMRVNVTVYRSGEEATRYLGKRSAHTDKHLFVSFTRKFKSLLARCSHVVFSGSLHPGLQDKSYGRLIALAKSFGKSVSLDTSGDPLRLAITSRPDILKLNLSEAEELLHRKLTSLPKLREAVNVLHQKGIKTVLITLGQKGAVGGQDGDFIFVKAPRVKTLNEVGCGDAFLAGFLYGRSQGRSFQESLQSAVAAGSANSQGKIPGLIRRDIFLKMLQWVRSYSHKRQ